MALENIGADHIAGRQHSSGEKVGSKGGANSEKSILRTKVYTVILSLRSKSY